jgi:hypothetical protein
MSLALTEQRQIQEKSCLLRQSKGESEKKAVCSDRAKANPKKKLFALTEQRQIQEKSYLFCQSKGKSKKKAICSDGASMFFYLSLRSPGKSARQIKSNPKSLCYT